MRSMFSMDGANSVNALIKDFKFERVLSLDQRTKTACILGHVNKSDGREACIMLIELIALEKSELEQFSFWFSDAQVVNQNDIYAWLTGTLAKCPIDRKSVKLQVICPAKATHILKYSSQERFIINETPEMYASITEPFIKNQSVSRIQWVYNILDKRAEQDSVIHTDSDPRNGYVLLPDSKWEKINLGNLHCQAIVQDRTLRSIRDLTSDHLPLLYNLRDSVFAHLEKAFSHLGPLQENKLRFYFHYQPSYYHLHLHIAALTFEGAGQFAGQAHLLETVIGNLELEKKIQKSNAGYRYYSEATIPFVYGSKHPLNSFLS